MFYGPLSGRIYSNLLFCLRENQCEIEASGSVSVPVHTLPSTYLQKVPEQPEDADNQKNVTRMIQPPLDKTTTVNIPVTITAPPGETTVIPSECLCPLALKLPEKSHLSKVLPVHSGRWSVLATSILVVGWEILVLKQALWVMQKGHLVALENISRFPADGSPRAHPCYA